MLERMVKGQGLLLVLVLSVFGSVSGSCFDDPTASACGDVAVYYNIVEDSLKPICSALPWVTGCAVYRQCEGEQAEERYCRPWSIMASICPSTLHNSGSNPPAYAAQLDTLCSDYRSLCGPSGTAVAECSQPTVPNMITTPQATADVLQLCVVHPSMEWCVHCTSTANSEACLDPLHTLASICLDHYMEDCARWYDMCREFPEGLDGICGNSDTDSYVLRNDDGELCVGIMKMYFHHGLSDYVLFRDWVPCTSSRYGGFFVVIVLLGIVANLVKAIRARLEQHWLRDTLLKQKARRGAAREQEAAPRGSECSRILWHLLPSSAETMQRNCVRAVFTAATTVLDYALMLISMTFNVGFFFAVVLGYGLGSLLFGHTGHPVAPSGPPSSTETRSGSTGGEAGSGDGLVAQGPDSIESQMNQAGAPIGSSTCCSSDHPS